MSSPDASTVMRVETWLIPKRHAVLARANLESLYVDYYLHLHALGLRPNSEHDALFKDTLAAFVLHCASRPVDETIAWTLHFQDPWLNLFVTGDNCLGTIVGQIFPDQVKPLEGNLFYSDVVTPQHPLRRSMVAFVGPHPFLAAEYYYERSEQRPARYFQVGDEDFVLISAQPECDVDWLLRLDTDAVINLEKTEKYLALAQRSYRWHCGCNQAKMLGVLASPMQQNPANLFGDEEALRISCPRCGQRYLITRETLEAFVSAQSPSPSSSS